MSATATTPSADLAFEATISGDDGQVSWFTVTVPDSGKVLGTRKPVKVEAVVDDHLFDATLLPQGDGTHMLPLRAAVRKAIGKGAGDQVRVRIARRHF